MRTLLTGAVVAFLALGVASSSYGESGILKVNAPIAHQLKLFGVKKPKNQSTPQTAWVCQTPGFWCTYFTPSWVGAACCCWAGGACIPGYTSG